MNLLSQDVKPQDSLPKSEREPGYTILSAAGYVVLAFSVIIGIIAVVMAVSPQNIPQMLTGFGLILAGVIFNGLVSLVVDVAKDIHTIARK